MPNADSIGPHLGEKQKFEPEFATSDNAAQPTYIDLGLALQ